MAVSGFVAVVSVCVKFVDGVGVIGAVGFRGFVMGLLYGLYYVYYRRWVFEFPIIQVSSATYVHLLNLSLFSSLS